MEGGYGYREGGRRRGGTIVIFHFISCVYVVAWLFLTLLLCNAWLPTDLPVRWRTPLGGSPGSVHILLCSATFVFPLAAPSRAERLVEMDGWSCGRRI